MVTPSDHAETPGALPVRYCCSFTVAPAQARATFKKNNTTCSEGGLL